jgi:heme exporter protein D
MLKRSPREPSFTSHPGEPEMLLLRTGHRLWAAYVRARDAREIRTASVLLAAAETVWEAKRVYRAERRRERQEQRVHNG